MKDEKLELTGEIVKLSDKNLSENELQDLFMKSILAYEEKEYGNKNLELDVEPVYFAGNKILSIKPVEMKTVKHKYVMRKVF